MEKRKERIDRGIKARSEDIFALSSWREMLYLLFPRAIPIVGLLFLVPFLTPYWREIFISTGVYALLAISWDMLISAGWNHWWRGSVYHSSFASASPKRDLFCNGNPGSTTYVFKISGGHKNIGGNRGAYWFDPFFQPLSV